MTVSEVNDVSALTTETLTPLITAPELSVIVPTSVPVPAVCANKALAAILAPKHRRKAVLIHMDIPLSEAQAPRLYWKDLLIGYYHTPSRVGQGLYRANGNYTSRRDAGRNGRRKVARLSIIVVAVAAGTGEIVSKIPQEVLAPARG